jgi:tetratricopeptide (TPR) repeat protein
MALAVVIGYVLVHFKTDPTLHYEFSPKGDPSIVELVLSLLTHFLLFFGVVASLLFCVAMSLMTVIHELGHVLAGLLVRFRLFKLAIGYGPIILRFYIFKTLLEIRMIPLGGATFHGYPSLAFIRTRIFLSVLAGPAANLAVSTIVIILLVSSSAANWTLYWYFHLLFSAFAVLNLFGLFSLIPMRVRMPQLGRTPTDGLILAGIPGLSDEILTHYHVNYFQEEGRYCSERGRHEEAKRWYEAGLALNPENLMLRFCFGNVQVPLGQFALSREYLLPLLAREDLYPILRPHILDTIAWANLMRADPELLAETDQFSKEACEAFPWSSYFAGTRGAVLVELGQSEAGMDLLSRALKKNNDAYNKAVNACYLALGEAQLGNREAAQLYLETARRLDRTCPVLKRIAKEVKP